MKTYFIPLFTLLFLAVGTSSIAQNFSLATGSTLKVTGTSSLHDWEIKANETFCDMTASMDASKIKIETLNFKVKSKSLKSDKDLMDKKTHEALKANTYPDITFKMSTPTALDLNNGTFKGTINGTIVLAGKSKNISVSITGVKKSNTSIQISGSKKLKMTEYGMEPPTAMMGTIKTGDEVTVHYNLILNTK